MRQHASAMFGYLMEEHLQRAGSRAAFPAGGLEAYLAGGKRLRGRLVFLAASVGCAPDIDQVSRYASFVELVHAGGLCHDDVVDRSAQRRARPSIGAAYGSRSAALAGLHLMFQGYGLIARESVEVRSAIARGARRVATGQADEMTDLFRLDVSEGTYVERCRNKTGALFELAADLGARAARLEEEPRRTLVAFAADVGLAFQLADDLRDFAGGPLIGRAGGTDLREGVYTLPVLLTAQGRYPGAAEIRRLIAGLRSGSDDERHILADVLQLLQENGAMEGCAEVVFGTVEAAQTRLGGIPGDSRHALQAYARELLFGMTSMMEPRVRAV